MCVLYSLSLGAELNVRISNILLYQVHFWRNESFLLDAYCVKLAIFTFMKHAIHMLCLLVREA